MKKPFKQQTNQKFSRLKITLKLVHEDGAIKTTVAVKQRLFLQNSGTKIS